MRAFLKVSKEQYQKDIFGLEAIQYETLKLPERATKRAAGYDFFSPIAFCLKPNEIIKIPTGIKVCMDDSDFLMLVIRSSLGFKYNIRLCNQIGIVDADYFNNKQNEGHILLKLQNEGSVPWTVNKGDRLIQGIFVKYLKSNNDTNNDILRTGGIGSTNKRGGHSER